MNRPEKNIFSNNFYKVSITFFLISVFCIGAFAQFKGAPVKKELLLKALKSKQLQTGDIVTVINTNGVDFLLTDDVRKLLIAAGARPEVIKAVSENHRPQKETFAVVPKPTPKPVEPNYDELLNEAIATFKEKQNPQNAVRFLESALKLKPKDPKAYQMLGFINLYGLNNLPEAQKYMRESIINGGSAVFRVYHDDNGDFIKRCSGSLYVSPEKIRFESDDNRHTFETSTVNVEKIKIDKETSRSWKNYPIFKVFLKLGDTEAKFRFAPINGKEAESFMAVQFINESKMNMLPVGMAANFDK